MTQKDTGNFFTKGYLCAIANLINMHGYGTECDDLFKCSGTYTVKQMRKIGVEEFDIQTLKPVIKEYKRKNELYKSKNQ